MKQRASLTICADAGSCILAQDMMAVTGTNGLLRLECTAAVPAVKVARLYTAGSGAVSVAAGFMGIQADTIVLQQDGVVEIKSGERALRGDLILPARSRLFVVEDSDTPSDSYETGAYLQVREHTACEVTEKEIGLKAPEASAISEQALMACYDEQGRLLAVISGTRDGDYWSFENPGVKGIWKTFFMDEGFAPGCAAKEVSVTGTAEGKTQTRHREDLQLMQDGSPNYDTAIAIVCWELGLLNYYEDGLFHEERKMTREEAAKVIARLANGGGNVSDLYGENLGLADVAETRWSAPYVGYCLQTGVITHMIKNDHYNPSTYVTDLEFAVMLMSVLGFDSRAMGYCDRDWYWNALEDAGAMGLLVNLENINNDSATRGEVAQMIWNALQADVAMGTIDPNRLAKALPQSAELLLALGNPVDPVWLPNNNRFMIDRDCKLVNLSDNTLLEMLYQMKADFGTADVWGRPGQVVNLIRDGGKIVYSYKKLEMPDQSYTADGDLNAALSEQISDGGWTAELHQNGTLLWENKKLDAALLKSVQQVMGNGVQTEIYLDQAKKHATFVVIEEHIAQVIAVNTERNTYTLGMLDGSEIEVFRNNENWEEAQWQQAQTGHDGSAAYIAVSAVKRMEPNGTVQGDMLFTADGSLIRLSDETGCVMVIEQNGTTSAVVLSGAEVSDCLAMHGADGKAWIIDDDGDGQPETLLISIQMQE